MSWFFQKVFLWGAAVRNPTLKSQFEELKKSENFPREKLLKDNLDELRRFVQFAYDESGFYRKRFESAGFNPYSEWSLEDFQKIPVVTKRDLIDHNQSIHTSISTTEKTFFCETSGTSGEILTFKRDEIWDSFNRAAIWRGYTWYGINPWDFSLYFWGYNSNWLKKIKLRLMDFLVNRYRVFDYDPNSLLKLKSKLKRVKSIEGYSSMIYELAKINENQDLEFSKLKMVKGTSEKVFPHYQDSAKKVYGHRIINEYGSAECSIIAYECPNGSMHITTEGLYVESDPDSGGILVTNLKSRSFPIIRYALGDQVVFADKDYYCTCGKQHPVILEVTGRIGKKIRGLSKDYPSLTLYYIFKNLYFNKLRKIDFQAHQFEVGKLEIWVKEAPTSELVSLIKDEAQKYFTDIDLSVTENHDFRQQKGKLRDFISHLD